MYISSRNGKRTTSVSRKTVDRVMEHVTQNPKRTVVEYAADIGVAESTINLVIENYLMDAVAAGRIAVSEHGRKPDWYSLVENQFAIPVRKSKPKTLSLPMYGINDRQLRQDCREISQRFQQVNGRKLSPRKRNTAWEDFSQRLSHMGGSFQSTMDNLRDALIENDHSQRAITEMSLKMNEVLTQLNRISHLVEDKVSA